MRAIADDAECAELEASDPLTAAATKASRESLADFFKALFVAIHENSQSNCGWIPDSFRLTDNTLASLANCVLDLEDDDLIEGTHVEPTVKRLEKECGQWVLCPENPKYARRYILEGDELLFWGVVDYSIRSHAKR